MKPSRHNIKIAVLETQVHGLKKNIKKQAKEYERRLTELNHAHANAQSDKLKFVNSELFYSKYDDLAKWRGEMDQWRSRIVGMTVGAGLAAGALGGLITGLVIKLVGTE